MRHVPSRRVSVGRRALDRACESREALHGARHRTFATGRHAFSMRSCGMRVLAIRNLLPTVLGQRIRAGSLGQHHAAIRA